MTTKRKTLWTRFDPGTRFEVSPAAAVPFRGTGETELEQFKTRLLRIALDEASDPEFYAPLRRAANEAAAAAWMTPFPLLFLPILFDEKAAAARRTFERAQSVRARSRRILKEAEVA
ncbi:MAG TPA: hypothetical protein VK846_04020 [Candidatus Limnocylindria bacterium]|nr:hypothetical protein [Candidatus Limnocylindria bacterium]